jgi:hypothetical protein
MKKIKFETSIGIFYGIIENNNTVTLRDTDYFILTKLYDFEKIIIHNDIWLKIILIKPYICGTHGDPEYKYEIIN